MATEVDICKLALSHIGEDDTLTSIRPPDDSMYAKQCAVYYPIARDFALTDQLHEWTFSLDRQTLTPLTNNLTSWKYAFALPSLCLNPLRVLPEGVDDESKHEPFYVEGTTLYTDTEVPTLVYQKRSESAAGFSPGFVVSVSHLLASYLAGVITKDKDLALAQRKLYEVEIQKARAVDASRQHIKPAKQAPHRDWRPAHLRNR